MREGLADSPKPVITGPIDESQLVTLAGNTTPAALRAQNDRGPVADNLRLRSLAAHAQARAGDRSAPLKKLIDEMHHQRFA